MAVLLAHLDREWLLCCRSSGARRAYAAWQADGVPGAEGAATPDALIGPSGVRRPTGPANRLAAALLERGNHDPLAARAVLQLVVPGLAGIASRCRHLVGGPFDSYLELESELVAFTCERIAAMSGTTLEWPITTLVRAAWERVRTMSRAYSRDRARRAAAYLPLPDLAAAEGADPGRELADVLTRAVALGVIAGPEAGLIFQTRVLGSSTQNIALDQGRDVRSVRKARSRSEQRLVRRAQDLAS